MGVAVKFDTPFSISLLSISLPFCSFVYVDYVDSVFRMSIFARADTNGPRVALSSRDPLISISCVLL